MYANLTDLKNLLPEKELLQLSDDVGTATTLATCADVVNEAIDQADREIDAYVSLVRAVPLSPVPGIIANLSARMAIHRLFTRRALSPEKWEKDHERALALLKSIATGAIKLGAGDAMSAPGGQVLYTAPAAKRFASLQEEW